MDFIEGPPKSMGEIGYDGGRQPLSKYSHFIALKHLLTAIVVAQAYMDDVYKLHGFPKVMVSDRVMFFSANSGRSPSAFKGWTCVTLQPTILKAMDKQRVNHCLETYLRCMTGECPTRWATWLSLAELWYNTTFHSSTKMTPFQVLNGHQPPLHLPYVLGDSSLPAVDQRMKKRECMIAVL